MNDASLIRVHRLQGYRTSDSLYLISNVSGQSLQSLLPAFSVVLNIQLYADIILRLLIYNQAGQVLKGIQCLSSLTNQDAHVIAL